MPKVNVYLPDELASSVRAAQLPVSTICQVALRDTLDRVAPVTASALPAALVARLDGPAPVLPLSPHLDAVLSLAPAAAARRGADVIATEDLLQALIDQQESLILRGLGRLGLTVDRIQGALDAAVEHREPRDENGIRFSPGATAALVSAADEARASDEMIVNGAHLVWALATSGSGRSAQILRDLGFFDISTRDALGLIEVGVVHAHHRAAAVADHRAEFDELKVRLDRIEKLLADLAPARGSRCS